MRQLSIVEIIDKKEQKKLTPEIHKCYKTCANFNCRHPDGTRDHFFDGSPRCINIWISKNTYSEIVDNMWHNYCRLYVPKK